jgi:RNA polymerase sigma factor (sigma-70 family)
MMPTQAVLRRLPQSDREMLEKRLSEPVECIYHPDFRKKTMPGGDEYAERSGQPALRLVSAPDGSTSQVASGEPTDVLTAKGEQLLFLRFNYARNRVMRILKKYRSRRLDAAGTRELLHWERVSQDLRTEIIQANTSLVLAMARRSRNSGVDLTELVSEGNLALLRCVDKFDASKGFKFSTYACRAILASFSRAGAKGARFRAHFPTSYDPAMERSDYLDRKRENIELECVDELREILFSNSASLSSVERRVLDARFSLDKMGEPTDVRRRTLDQVGNLLGVSKERVRQIQNQAIDKLRAVLETRLPAAS